MKISATRISLALAAALLTTACQDKSELVPDTSEAEPADKKADAKAADDKKADAKPADDKKADTKPADDKKADTRAAKADDNKPVGAQEAKTKGAKKGKAGKAGSCGAASCG